MFIPTLKIEIYKVAFALTEMSKCHFSWRFVAITVTLIATEVEF